MKHLLLTTITAAVLVGCASTKRLNLSTISIGMDKQKVISLHGEPFRIVAMNGSDTLFIEAVIRHSLNPMGLWSTKFLSGSKAEG